MGLSSKEVSSDGHGWNKALMQGTSSLELIPKPSSSMKKQSSSSSSPNQSGPLRCPRCDSTNTKFCYYNNYNKSQPRHFCKACKRHWTKGGTLRNVPVGGGRKNKRKTSASKAASKTTTTTTATLISGLGNGNMTIQPQQPRLTLPLGTLGGVGEKNLSEAFYQTLGRQPIAESSIPFTSKSMNEGNIGNFLGLTTLTLPPQNEQDLNLNFPYSTLVGSLDQNNPCSIPTIQSSNIYDYTGDHQANNSLEETMMNSLNTNLSNNSMSMTEQNQQNWSMAATINNNWGWDDFDKFVSVDEAELTIPWDDADIKP